MNIVHVPYKGTPPAMTDLLAGHVVLTFATAPSAVPHVQAGRLRALGVSSATRIPALPDVPTIAEAGVCRVMRRSAGTDWWDHPECRKPLSTNSTAQS